MNMSFITQTVHSYLLVMRKEMRVWLRDPKVFIASLFAPLVLLLAFVPIATGRPIDLAVTDLDNSQVSRNLVNLLAQKENPLGGTYFSVHMVDQDEGSRLYQQQALLAWLTIPEGLGKNVSTHKLTYLSLAIDNYHTDIAKNIRLYLNEAFVDIYKEESEMPLEIQEIHESGRKVNWIQSIGMGLIGLSVILAGLFNGFNSLLSEYQSGTIKTLLLAPRSTIFLLASKATYALIGAVLSGIIMFSVLVLLTGLMVTDVWGGFLLMVFIAGLVYVNLGMIIGLLVRRYMPAAATSMVFGVVTWFLSGSLGELRLYTATIRAIAACLPITYLEEGLRGLVLYHNTQALWINSVMLVGFLVLTLIALAWVQRKKLRL